MIVALGSDHGGLHLKTSVIKHLQTKGIKTIDFGAYENTSSDYPDYAKPVCNAVLSKEANFGILICGTGVGMSITANKINGIRCALLGDVFSAKATREHNDANVMSMGERVTGEGLALEIVDAFLGTAFSNEPRHLKRIQKVMKFEKR